LFNDGSRIFWLFWDRKNFYIRVINVWVFKTVIIVSKVGHVDSRMLLW
jgi:hypothetical protein